MPVPGSATGATQTVRAKMEPVVVLDEERYGPAPVAVARPVIRVKSPHVRGGEMVFTRIDPKNVDTSMIVHVRPGWNDLYAYLTGEASQAHAPNAVRGVNKENPATRGGPSARLSCAPCPKGSTRTRCGACWTRAAPCFP